MFPSFLLNSIHMHITHSKIQNSTRVKTPRCWNLRTITEPNKGNPLIPPEERPGLPIKKSRRGGEKCHHGSRKKDKFESWNGKINQDGQKSNFSLFRESRQSRAERQVCLRQTSGNCLDYMERGGGKLSEGLWLCCLKIRFSILASLGSEWPAKVKVLQYDFFELEPVA